MKIKIIEPYYYNKKYDIRSLTPALGPVMVATLLKQDGHEVEVMSEYVANLDLREANQADLVGISITTYNSTRGYEIAKEIKRPVVFGGLHASLRPEESLKYGDYVIRGDGHPIVDLARCLAKGSLETLSEVPNLAYSRNGRIRFNAMQSWALNVVPDFTLVKDYYKLNLRRLLRIPLLVSASRGCSFDCSFCAIKEVYKDTQKRDKAIVIEDITSQIRNQHPLSKLFPRGVWIVDDNFFGDREWAMGVLTELSRIVTDHVLVVQARMDIANDNEMLELMTRANISRVYLGIESLNQKSLENFNKRSAVTDIAGAVRKIRRFGIEVHGLFVFGDDEFERGDGLKIAEFVQENKLSGLLIQPLTPFPGTKTFEKLRTENRLLHQEWHSYSGKVVFRPKKLTAAELQQEIYACYKKVYSPIQLLRFLLFGRRGFRLGTLGEGMMRYREASKMRNYMRDALREDPEDAQVPQNE